MQEEKLAVVELTSDELTMCAVYAPRESLPLYPQKHIPKPIPSGKKNILNKRHGGLTLLHESVMLLTYSLGTIRSSSTVTIKPEVKKEE